MCGVREADRALAIKKPCVVCEVDRALAVKKFVFYVCCGEVW